MIAVLLEEIDYNPRSWNPESLVVVLRRFSNKLLNAVGKLSEKAVCVAIVESLQRLRFFENHDARALPPEGETRSLSRK